MAFDVSKGIPQGRPTKKMPKPFQRPRLEIGKTEGQQRSWQWVAPAKLAEGDIVPGYGLVHSVEEVVWSPQYESGLSPEEVVDSILWTVQLTAGVPTSKQYRLDPATQVWAYSLATDE